MRAGDTIGPEAARADVDIDTDPSRIDIDRVHGWLRTSYWLEGVRRDVVERAARNSVVVGAYLRRDGRQVGYARAVTDRATVAYVADVFVEREHRGRGVASRMLRTLHDHPELQTLKAWILATADAQPLYVLHGYEHLDAARWMGRGMPRSRWQEPADAADEASPRTPAPPQAVEGDRDGAGGGDGPG